MTKKTPKPIRKCPECAALPIEYAVATESEALYAADENGVPEFNGRSYRDGQTATGEIFASCANDHLWKLRGDLDIGDFQYIKKSDYKELAT